jgi:hypothetical protein
MASMIKIPMHLREFFPMFWTTLHKFPTKVEISMTISNSMAWFYFEKVKGWCDIAFIGTLTRDFRSLVFSSTTSPVPLIHGLKPFRIWLRIREGNRQGWLHSGVNDTAMHITVVSMTPLCMSQQYQWHRCACHSSANDTAVHITAVSLTPLCAVQPTFFQTSLRIIRQTVFIRKSGSAAYCTAVSLTPLWHLLRCQWHRCENMTSLWLWIKYSRGSGYL